VAQIGQPGGVVVAEIDLRDIWLRVDEIRIEQTGRAFVVSQDGLIIAHPDRAYIGQRIAPELEPVLAGFEGQTGYRDPISGHLMLAAYSPVGGPSKWGVVVEQEQDEALARINRIAFIGFGVLIVALAIATTLTVLIARDVTQPIQGLAQVTQTIAQTGDLSRDIQVDRRDEVGQLAAAFNQMIAGLREAQTHLLRTQAMTQELSYPPMTITARVVWPLLSGMYQAKGCRPPFIWQSLPVLWPPKLSLSQMSPNCMLN
jgi:HAMP domain-containing protein